MSCSVVLERVERIATTRVDTAAGRGTVEAALRDVSMVRGWLASAEADLAKRLVEQASFPEGAIADTTRVSPTAASKVIDRSRTLDEAPDLASLLDAGKVTADHIDAVTRAAKDLEPGQRRELIERCDGLSSVAEQATSVEWGKRVRDEARRIQREDGMVRLERQRRATSMTSWTDDDGMWCLSAKFDPVTGVKVAARLDAAVEALFTESTPNTCPSDPVSKQRHLRALALARLIDAHTVGDRPARAEFVVVIDTTTNASPGPTGETAGSRHVDWDVSWPIPVEIPTEVITRMITDGADVSGVIVRNGIVLYAPGTLDLGRTSRLANKAQRRALRGLYPTCAVPGCRVGYERCKLHHIVWWRNGGPTDLDNLLPVCSVHHAKIHHDGWTVNLGANRELTITLPDGTVMTTGPPHRRTA